ncbi:MAG: response regulator [Chthoniobacter sp.]|nr:response regulator [Chthoniobacter sp.]
MKNRILIADDEPDAVKLLDSRLVEQGFEVLHATDGLSALGRVRKESPTLAILDVMMPEMSGMEVCRTLKGDPKTARIPIMLLTARNEEVDRVLGFEFGADDYVTKPFSPREVVLRVQALLRRLAPATTASVGSILHVGGIIIDGLAHRVTVHNQVVELTRTEFKLLRTLMENTGRVLKRADLLQIVWPTDANIEIRTVDTHLRRLREKLGTSGQLIQTIRGFGYRIDNELI